jgi:hypothetical protein
MLRIKQGNNLTGETKMQNVHLSMTDQMTGETVERTIDIGNAMSNGSVCWELRGEDEQRANLERWIDECGNEQHNTFLRLDSWTIS